MLPALSSASRLQLSPTKCIALVLAASTMCTLYGLQVHRRAGSTQHRLPAAPDAAARRLAFGKGENAPNVSTAGTSWDQRSKLNLNPAGGSSAHGVPAASSTAGWQPTTTTLAPAVGAPAAGTTVVSRPVLYIRFIDPKSGLGNKMFQYASGLGLALRHGCDACLVVDHPGVASGLASMKQAFALSALPEQPTAAPPSVPALHESGWGRYDAKKFDDNKTFASSVAVHGYLQSWRYFQPVADRVRQEFALTPKTVNSVEAFFKQMSTARGELLIGVHVRRGDMAAHPNLYTVAPPAYLKAAVTHYVAKYGESHRLAFLFATNDRGWVNDFVAHHMPTNVTVRHLSFSAEVDMAILGRCNHSIVTAGTFGWWSAWLAGGDVVYFKDFMQSSSRLHAGYDPADYYPPQWLGLA